MNNMKKTFSTFRWIFRTWAVLVCCFGLSAFAQAQQRITGKVTDGAGEPIVGANVIVVGTTMGATTNPDGRYELSVPAGAELTASFVGYDSVTRRVAAGQTVLDFTLTDNTTALDDVVVIGYGAVKRRDLTGAIASVKGEDLAANPVSDVSQALQGRLPGVNVISQDGRPGAEVSVRVRGGGSVTQSNNPLFVVDGFPVSSISDIPASEIETIDVLKDASSTAIYGARGANGVILVTTKGAKSGNVKVSYDGWVQLKKVAKTVETLSAQDYVLNSWSYAASRGSANQDAVERYFGLGKYGNHFADYAGMETHDYTNDVLRLGVSHNHTVNVSGGTEKTQAVFTFNYLNDEGIKINSDLNRANVSLKLRQQLAKRLHFDLDLRYAETKQNGREGVTNGRGSTVSSAYMYRPIDRPLGGVTETDVTSGFGFGIENIDDAHNPVELLNDIIDKSERRSLRGSAALSWEIIDGLTARTELSLSRGSSKSQYYENGYTNGYKTATLSRGWNKGLRSVTTLNYDFKAGEANKFSVLLGNEVLTSSSESSMLTGRGYPDTYDFDKTMGLIHMATTSFSATNSLGVPERTVSFFGRVNYTLLDRFLFTVTMRAVGSS